MSLKCKPVCKKGDRNVFCRYYGDCLNYVIKKSWEYWDCGRCLHRLNQEGKPEIQLTVSESIEYV